MRLWIRWNEDQVKARPFHGPGARRVETPGFGNRSVETPGFGKQGFVKREHHEIRALSSAEVFMGWFTKFCRNAGLAVHNVTSQAKQQPGTKKKEVNRHTEEQKLDEQTTLRRTTIDEVEVKRKDSGNKDG